MLSAAYARVKSESAAARLSHSLDALGRGEPALDLPDRKRATRVRP